MEKGFTQLKSISIPSDRIEKDDQCLVVTCGSHRRELIQRYLVSNDQDVSISFSSVENKRDPCDLLVEKTRTKSSSSQQVDISGKSAGATASTSSGTATETFEITTLNDFELSVDLDSVKGSCRSVTPERYEITLTVEKTANPLTPPVPAGTIIIVNNPPPPVQTSRRSTTVQLARGDKVEIGSLIKNLKDQNKEVNASPRFDTGNNEEMEQERTFLSIR